ncbi:MAG: hypothetical protein A3A81_04700 [Omnitrophica bacterium RIFCSPLOWO2_01_FULL_45_10b]|nr:MAG: hypothetical protein A3A81_04700 [Omnitrophica bacterium RIFCSPLOWO2_01_FULL_45_10b]
MPWKLKRNLSLAGTTTALIFLVLTWSHGAQSAEITPTKSLAKTIAFEGTFLEKIESQRGAPLTEGEKQRFIQTIQAIMEAVKVQRFEFIQKISQITKLSPTQISQIMPKIGRKARPLDENMIPKIEVLLGRTLTTDEMHEIHAADQERKQAMAPIREGFVTQLTLVTGLSPEAVSTILSTHLKVANTPS